MTQNEFLERVPGFIRQAKRIAYDISEGKIALTTDIRDIARLDAVIDQVRNLCRKGLIEDNVAWNTSVLLGVVLGEMIAREEGLHWLMSRDGVPVVGLDRGNCISPITKIYKIFTSKTDDEGTARSFYRGFKAIRQYCAMSDEEKSRVTTYVRPD